MHSRSRLYAGLKQSACFVKPEGRLMLFDILIAVAGTGGILLMVAYAALCERI